MRLLFALVIGLTGCFNPTLNEVACGPFRECPNGLVCGDDDVCRPPAPSEVDASTPDGPVADPNVFDAAHLPPGSENPGDVDAVIAADLELDTTGLIAPIPGAVFEIVDQESQGPELAVLRVRSLSLAEGVTLRVRGSRGLVIVASDTVAIDGVIDARAQLDRPGPGAVPAGSGGPGVIADGFFSAGGGGGFADLGGAGGSTEGVAGGEPGATIGVPELSVLTGGSPGGSAAAGTGCAVSGGAGGGAVQISTPASIEVGPSGIILVGGGGGSGGVPCPGGVGGPGGGGGSGGAIYLQAPRVVNAGALVADGGGGGGGSGDDDNEPGDPGTDAISGPGTGGNAGNDGGDGGDGGGELGASAGEDNRTNNGAGGGGGGAVGRIAVDGELTDSGSTSPSIFVIPADR